MGKATTKVKRDGVASFSFDGVEYRAGRDGSIEIPLDALEAAIELGLAQVLGRKSREGESE